MNKRKRQSPQQHGVYAMQPRVYQEPPAPDDSAPREPTAPADSSGTAAAAPPPEAPTPPPAPELPVAVPYHEPPPAAPSVNQLEDRLGKLEDVLKTLRAQQFTTTPPAPAPLALPNAAALLQASQLLLPFAGQALQPFADPNSALRNDGPIVFEVYAEVRCMVRMYVDPRYQLSWLTRCAPPVLLVLMVLSWFILGGMAYLGPLVEHLTFAVLVYLLYKVLGREAQRYRQTSPDLPPSLRP